MCSIVTLTLNPAVDKSTVARGVAPDRKLRCHRPRREPGGGGLNVSRALRRLGADSLALLMAGGPTGEILRGLLEEEGVRHNTLETREWTRENLMVREEGEGDHQYRFDMPGPRLSEGEWKACLRELEALNPTPDYLVASGSLPPGAPSDLYARVGEVARDLGARFVLDSSGEALEDGLGSHTFLVKPNLRELAALTGRRMAGPGEDRPAGSGIREAGEEGEAHGDVQERDGDPGAYEGAQSEAARKLIQEGRAEVVMVSMGSAGALLVTRDESRKISTPTVPIRSRVGAGDSTVAGLVLGLAWGMDLATAARLGVATGAAAVMTPGSELCRREDAEALFARMTGGSGIPERNQE